MKPRVMLVPSAWCLVLGAVLVLGGWPCLVHAQAPPAMEQAVAQTGMEYGAITPVGLPPGWAILIDKKVADSDYVIIGSGIRKSKLAVSGKFLASLPNAQVLECLGQQKTS